MNPLLIRMVLGGIAGYGVSLLYDRLTSRKTAPTIENNSSIDETNDSGKADTGDGSGRSDNGGDSGGVPEETPDNSDQSIDD